MAITYTTANKVANILGYPDGYFTASSTPTSTVVESFIDQVEGRIDEMTMHSWRATSITKEYIEPESVYRYGTGIRFKLLHRSIRTIDKLEIWESGSWVDYVATKTEGRDKDYWFDERKGIVYVNSVTRVYPHGLRADYTYGETTVKSSITLCASMMTALMILNSPEFSVVQFTQSGESSAGHHDDRKRIWQKDVDKIIQANTEFQ